VVAHRFALQVVADLFAWTFAIFFADLLRHDLLVTGIQWDAIFGFGALATVVQIGVGCLFGLYIGRWQVGSFEEVQGLVGSAVVTTAVLFVINLVTGMALPRSAVVGGGLVALVVTAGFRFTYRRLLEYERRARSGDKEQRLLLFGAGDAGYRIVQALLADPDAGYHPIAALDDDPRKRNRRMNGVPVVGGRAQLADAARRYGATALLIAIPSADAALIGELTRLGVDAGLVVKTVPSIGQLFGTDARITDIRDVTEEDLLGRHRVHTDVDSIAQYITGRRVLVTGAGGSIGSELCRQLYRFAPSELIMLDRDESALHAVQLSIDGRALLDGDALVLHDIRDRIGLDRVFRDRKPEVVFHAAALKHLPLLERHPIEAVKTNVWGTLALLETARANNVERFVNISTDKAAEPVSVLGYSKRICERLTSHFGTEAGRPYLSVRFGNVLGSRGSMLGTFRAQIANGGPLTVTDQDVTRYFMTVEEATQLVIQAGAIGGPGEVLVLDMGEPVRIVEVARLLAAQAPRPIDITFTGLRPGEKLHEDLFGAGEEDTRPHHPLISHAGVPPLEPYRVQDLDPTGSPQALVSLLRVLCSEGITADPYR